ncbi:hypothetical protein HVW95_05200 [Escherichia coli]|nr:hypothetical protein HVW96_05200 [Escherichia coli]QMM79662.1 hypothetical protein HVW95_05200 [Escherichia coli]
MPPHKDVEQKLTIIIIFLALITLKTTGYKHDDDDDKITKMRLFPRRPAPWTGLPYQENPQNDDGYQLHLVPVSSTIAPDRRP